MLTASDLGRQRGKTHMVAQMSAQEVEDTIKGIRVGMCNYKNCDCALANTADGFCEEHWALLERDKRQELVFERNRFVKNKRKYWFQYSMALAGAKIYLKA